MPPILPPRAENATALATIPTVHAWLVPHVRVGAP